MPPSSAKKAASTLKQLSHNMDVAAQNWSHAVEQIERVLSAMSGLQRLSASLSASPASLLAPYATTRRVQGRVLVDLEALWVQLRMFAKSLGDVAAAFTVTAKDTEKLLYELVDSFPCYTSSLLRSAQDVDSGAAVETSLGMLQAAASYLSEHETRDGLIKRVLAQEAPDTTSEVLVAWTACSDEARTLRHS